MESKSRRKAKMAQVRDTVCPSAMGEEEEPVKTYAVFDAVATARVAQELPEPDIPISMALKNGRQTPSRPGQKLTLANFSASALASQAGVLLLIQSVGAPPGLELPAFQLEASTMPSVGSAQHAAGLCKPCAWFWKPQGCKNGEMCCHCHLCPQDEHTVRKRARKAADHDAQANFALTQAVVAL